MPRSMEGESHAHARKTKFEMNAWLEALRRAEWESEEAFAARHLWCTFSPNAAEGVLRRLGELEAYGRGCDLSACRRLVGPLVRELVNTLTNDWRTHLVIMALERYVAEGDEFVVALRVLHDHHGVGAAKLLVDPYGQTVYPARKTELEDV